MLAVAAGLATALFRLGAKGLWGDEVWQVSWAQQQGFARTFFRFLAPPDFALHFLLVKLSSGGSSNPWLVRLPSALLGAASVGLLFVLARRVLETRTALIAALIFAAAPLHVWYAQDARPYAALAFYSLLSLHFFFELIDAPSRLAWLGFMTATVLNLYNQFFAIQVLLTECAAAVGVIGLWALLSRFDVGKPFDLRHASRSFGGVVAGGALALLAAMPLWPGTIRYVLAGAPGESDGTPFRVTVSFLANLFGLFGAGPGWPLAVIATLCLVGILAACYHRPWFALVAVVWLGLPFVALALAQPKHQFIPRYFIFIQPVYLLLAAYGLVQILEAMTRIFRRASTVSALVVVGSLLWLTFRPTWSGYWVEKLNDWSAICGYLHREVKPGDSITGDAYIISLMRWCYPDWSGLSIINPESVSLPRSGIARRERVVRAHRSVRRHDVPADALHGDSEARVGQAGIDFERGV